MLRIFVLIGVVLIAGSAFAYGFSQNRVALSGSAAAADLPAADGGAPAAAAPVTRETLRMHASKESCWVAFEGKVYDVTGWLPRHPGGSRAIERYCGTAEEFTAAFSAQHGASKASRLDTAGIFMGPLTE